MRTSIALTLASVAIANADVLQWHGLSAGWTNDAMWQPAGEPNPLGTSAPLSIVIGELGETTVVAIPAATYQCGDKIEFRGDTKLLLGDGKTFSKTVLQLGAGSDPAEQGTKKVIFAPSSFTDLDGPIAEGFDYNCNLNWRKNNGQIPANPPCVGDRVEFPNTGSYAITTFGKTSGAKNMRIKGDSNYEFNSCPEDGNVLVFGSNPVVVVTIPKCDNKFQWDTTSASTCPTTCPPDAEFPDEDGNTIKVYTKGSNAGMAIKVTSSGQLVDVPVNVTSDINGDMVVIIGDRTIDSEGNIMTPTPTQTPTLSPVAGPVSGPGAAGCAAAIVGVSNGQRRTVCNAVVGCEWKAGQCQSTNVIDANLGIDDASGAVTTIIAVVAVVAVLIIVGIVVAVVMIRKGSSKPADDRNIVSFENPMYDDVNAVKQSSADISADNTTLYDDPEVPLEQSSGYVDIPAANDNSGYMDVPAQQPASTGYMDVAPEEDDGHYEDYDKYQDYDTDDDEDI